MVTETPIKDLAVASETAVEARAVFGLGSRENSAIVDERALRVAENQNTFRSANEQIEETAQDLADSLTLQRIPFLCECADARCTKVIQLTLADYADVRAGPRRFAVAPGHEVASGDERVISRSDRFTTVEKVGEAGRIVAESDPR